MNGICRTLQSAVSCWGILMAALMLVIAAPAQIVAQEVHAQHEATVEEHEATDEEHAAGEEHGEAHSEEHHLHKHHFGVFLGATEGIEAHGEEHGGDGHVEPHSEGSGGGKDDPGFTIGFDYERRFTQLFGFGGMVDWVVEGNREWLIGPIAFLHPVGGAKLYAAPCFERVTDTSSNEFVFRVGASWDFEVGKYWVGPHLIYDFSDEHDLWVVGIGIGRGF